MPQDPFNRGDRLYVFFLGDRWVGDWPADEDPDLAEEIAQRLREAADRGWRWELQGRRVARALAKTSTAGQNAFAHYRPINGKRAWTEKDDRFLLAYGWCVGVGFVADHDLDRDPDDARRRVRWLAKHKPDLFAELWEGEEALEDILRWDAESEAEQLARAKEPVKYPRRKRAAAPASTP